MHDTATFVHMDYPRNDPFGAAVPLAHQPVRPTALLAEGGEYVLTLSRAGDLSFPPFRRGQRETNHERGV